MRFGIGLFSMQTHKDLDYSHVDLYRNSLDHVRLAETVDFDSVWLSEHHFLEDGYCSSPLGMAAAMAAVTERVRIGTGALILTLHNPVRVAEDAATVDLISGGRFDLGVAIGYRKEEFEGFGVPMTQRPSRIEEGIEIIEKCWEEGSFSYEGKRFSFRDIDVTPKPVQRPIPIYIGAFEEPAVRRAGRLGYPLLIGPGRTVPMIMDTLGWYNDEAEKAGRDPSGAEHILLRETYVRETMEEATAGGTEYIINMYRFYLSLGVKIVIRGKNITDPDDPFFEYMAEDRFMIGTPGHCVEEVRKYAEKTGIQNIMCRMVFPQASAEVIAHSIELFGNQVIPEFR
ncbi:MAG: LLM class flavin-dependent oxidoreductase [Candidatus Dadabacteria bacterium]|nr:LLM class flavin-dependent oxidoreductase [Candidatus Dadabacteria bacterium]MDE0519573.1 LLM class flavin-dependent oxidoreductase [Candidatus Dadabacteria bacterium]MDE0663501.1 LLM class flavin-dependent oxidoreductase [Candidatus Dadabacteria bacterium]